jgi:hypothetical protein
MRKHKPVNQLYRWVHSEIGILYEIGRYKEGTIRNPRGYPEDVGIRASTRLSNKNTRGAARPLRKAPFTRKRRQAKLIHDIAKGITEGRKYGPRNNCVLCGRGLTDQESIQRGIGSECWQGVLAETERVRDQRQRQGVIDGLLTAAQ